MRRLTIAALVGGLLAVMLVAPQVYGADTVQVRGGAHEGYGRIVFDWPSPVQYSARVVNQVLSVRFDRSFTARFGPAVSKLRDHVLNARISSDGRTALIRLLGDYTVKSFRNESAIVVDFRPGGKTAVKRKARARLPIRVGQHPTYTRIVFDWIKPTRYTAVKRGGEVEISFGELVNVDQLALAGRLPQTVALSAVRDKNGGTVLILKVPQDARLRHFRSTTRIVVDVLLKAPSQKITEAPKAVVPKKKPAPLTKGRATKGQMVKPALTPVATAVPSSPAPHATTNRYPKATVDPKASSVTLQVAHDHPALAKPKRLLPPVHRKPLNANAHAAPTPVQVAAAPPAATEKPEGLVQFRKVTGADRRRALKGKKASVSLVFEWSEPVSAAVFKRVGYTWIIFDKRRPLDLSLMRLAGRGILTKIEQLPILNASVIRISTVSDVRPMIRQDGTNWIVDFSVGEARPEIPIPIEPNLEAEGGPELFISATEVGAILNLPDPEVGDVLQIATVKVPGHGVKGDRAYPEFQLVGTVQGVVLQALNDDVVMWKKPEGLVISLPGGLHISNISPDVEDASAAVNAAR